MALLNPRSHQAMHLVKLSGVAEVVDQRAVQPNLNRDIFPLHQLNLIKCQFVLVLTKESHHHPVPSSRAQSQPPVSKLLKDYLAK
jgi:hypothetical protein